MTTQPSPDEEWNPQCDYCPSRYSTRWEREEHMRSCKAKPRPSPDLAALSELLEQASPRPWVENNDGGYSRGHIYSRMTPSGYGPPGEYIADVIGDSAETDANAELICAAVNALPALLAAARRVPELEGELARLETRASALAAADGEYITSLEARANAAEERVKGWKPASEAPEDRWLLTYRNGESGPSVSMVRRFDGDDEWIAPDGRTTVTHHSYAAPDWFNEEAEHALTQEALHEVIARAALNKDA